MNSYKDSGVEWIGEMPKYWKVKKIKQLVTNIKSLFKDGDWIESKDILESGIRYLTSGNVGEGYYKEQGESYISKETFDKLRCLEVYPGDLMISRLNLPVGRACIVPDKYPIYVVAVDNVILRPDNIYSKKFLLYIMNTDGYAKEAELISRGTTMKRISRSLLGEIKIAVPNLTEQKQIAEFLDKKCAEIDSISSKIEKQIELLKEYKKSLITETVTKGLDKNVPMKDSGIEWIGDIPKYWDMRRLRYLANFKTGGTPSEKFGIDTSGDYPWVTASDINSYYIESYQQYISKEAISLCNYKIFPNNTILIVCIASIGKIGIVRHKSYSNQQITAIHNTVCDERFLLYSMIQQIEKIRLDASSSVVPIINTSYLKDVCIALPEDREEQLQVADFLDKKCSEIDSIISKKERQLDLMKEHRKSLIYEYVTGKKRVGGVDYGN